MSQDQNSPSLLGWKVHAKEGAYDSRLPVLSSEEEELLSIVSNNFSEYAKENDVSTPELAKNAIEKILPETLDSEGLEADDEQKKYLMHAALSHLSGFAPLDKMLSDPSIEEIAAIGINKPIYVYIRKKGWLETNASFSSMDHLIHTINKMARPLGRRITSQSPRLNALLLEGHRLHASIPSLSEGELTIRLHSATPWNVADIMAAKSSTPQALAFLWLAFQSDSSILIAGNTSSGKTTLLNSLFSFVPLYERIVLIEETPEIRLAHRHVAKLVSSEELCIPMGELVRDSLRMRPDRVIVGEVRTPPEAQAFAETLLSGQARGSYATFHAQSAQEALRRLANLGISDDDLPSLNFIAVQRRLARYDSKKKKQVELRRMTGIYMVSKSQNSPEQISLLPIFEYDARKDALNPAPAISQVLLALSLKLGISQKACEKIFKERAKFLSRLSQKDGEKILQKIQKFAYGDIAD